MNAPRRWVSVDALRGLTVAAMLLVNNPGDWSHVYAPLLHSEWHGCTPTDLVFPFFLFIVGVSIALGIVPRVEAGVDRTALRRTVLVRAGKLILLGLLLHLLAYWLLDKPAFRPWGVLQRIGLCFGVAGLVVIGTRASFQWMLIAVLLLGYSALMAAGGSYEPWVNLASRLDTALLGAMNYQFDPLTGRGHDPEGLLSTLPAIATTLLGVRAGTWLGEGRRARLFVLALCLLVAGYVLSAQVPLNKNLWTSTYALWTAGWAALALLAAHQLVEGFGLPALGRRFGVNAMAAYVGGTVMVLVFAGLGWWEPLYRHGFSDWMTPRFGPFLPSLAFALAFVGLWWGVVRAMDQAGWYWKV